MKREYARGNFINVKPKHFRSNPVSQEIYNTVPNSTNSCRCTLVIVVATLALISYVVLHKPEYYLDDPSDQFVVRNIPEIYLKLEAVDPEEKEVFQSFRTSYLPSEELVIARRDTFGEKGFYEGNVSSDNFIWDSTNNQNHSPRLKRTSHFAFSSKEHYDGENPSHSKHRSDRGEIDDDDDKESESDEEYDSSESDDFVDNQDVRRVAHPEHEDRGPLDDVVEQVRGQPELEEGEMGSSVYMYKPGKSYAGIHAFWKGQGDKETIRTTQANIMRKYMDAEADPCHDFYQYACGNWAPLNPIPADKAGYDTFEMLRENLDAVLKELLEFKSNEQIPSVYPGKHLDLHGIFLSTIMPSIKATKKSYPQNIKDLFHLKDLLSPEILGNFHFGRRPIQEYIEYEASPDPNILHDYLDPYSPETTKNVDSDILSPPINTGMYQITSQSAKRINSMTETTNPNRSEIVYRIRRYTIPKRKTNMKYETHKYPFKNKLKRVKRFKKKLDKKHHKKQKRKINNAKIRRMRVGRKLHMFVGKRNGNTPKRHIRNTEANLVKTSKSSASPSVHNDPANGDAALKARFLFKSCMNYEILEKRGHRPLIDLLNLLGGWPILDRKWKADKFDWLETMAKLRLYNNDILISEWVGPDIKNSDEFVIQFDQTSLGLPTRDYFLQDLNKPYLDAYKNYLIRIAILLGGQPSFVRTSAEKLIQFEIQLAKITSAPEDRRNVSELYNRMPLQKLEELVPEVQWRRYLCVVMNRTVESSETVVMFALTYVRNLVDLINETEPSVLANYLLWRFVRHRANNLDDRFQSAKQQFYFILFGREQAPPRWKNCISQVNSNMGMALGSMFVKKYFDETSKNDTLRMTREIQQSFKELLHKTDWIDDNTKKLAAHKVEAMMLRIGYPDFILDKNELNDRYKEVRIHPDKYFENILNILQHLTKMEQSRIGQPVNKTLWNTAPAVVNAYYSRNKNQIMFPAGILQPPFYHRHFPRSLNYGGIGVVIGHEITHGFDDKGRLFDCNGNLHRWWSDSAIEAFHQRAQCLIDQYGQYILPEVNMKLDGLNTQGENIADNGGVKQAFRAYLHWLQHHGTDGETLPGLNHTHTQLFFLNFAQVWCGAMRPEAMRNKLKTAVHSPGRFRVIGTLSNSHDFAREFQCPPGSPMNPKEKCSVWTESAKAKMTEVK